MRISLSLLCFGNKIPGNYLIENGPQSNNSYVKNLGSIFDYEIHFDRQVDSMGNFFLS